MNRHGVSALCIGIAALAGAMCTGTGTPFVGPTTEQGNPQIVAVVVDDNHRPISSATVYVYRVPVYFDSVDQPPSSAILLYASPTDSNGMCSFGKLVPGTYSIKAIDADSTHSKMITNIPISSMKPDTPDYQDTLVLAVPGNIHGIVTRGGVLGNIVNQNMKDAFIQVKIGEMDRSTITGPDGGYTFIGLPAGTYTIYYYAADGFYSAKRENVVVESGNDMTLDSVVLKPVPRLLPPKEFGAVYDTSEGVVRLYWQKVNYEALWYYVVERKCLSESSFDTLFPTSDTVLFDTLGSIPAETVLYYVVRSIDKAINPSVNAGPIVIRVADFRRPAVLQ